MLIFSHIVLSEILPKTDQMTESHIVNKSATQRLRKSCSVSKALMTDMETWGEIPNCSLLFSIYFKHQHVPLICWPSKPCLYLCLSWSPFISSVNLKNENF